MGMVGKLMRHLPRKLVNNMKDIRAGMNKSICTTHSSHQNMLIKIMDMIVVLKYKMERQENK